MDQAAIDAIVYWSGAYYVMGFAVGIIVKFLIGKID